MEDLCVILYEPESIIKMHLSSLFRRHGADVREIENMNELILLLRREKSSEAENHRRGVGGRKLVVLGEPPPHREEYEIVHSLPRRFPDIFFILLACEPVFTDTGEESLFHGVVNKPFRFRELLDTIASLINIPEKRPDS